MIDEKGLEQDIANGSPPETVHVRPPSGQSPTDRPTPPDVDVLTCGTKDGPKLVERCSGSASNDHLVGLEVEDTARCRNDVARDVRGGFVLEKWTSSETDDRSRLVGCRCITKTFGEGDEMIGNDCHVGSDPDTIVDRRRITTPAR